MISNRRVSSLSHAAGPVKTFDMEGLLIQVSCRDSSRSRWREFLRLPWRNYPGAGRLYVAVQITQGAGEVIAADRLQRMAHKLSRLCLLQQNDGIEFQSGALGKVSCRQKTDNDDVEVPVS